MSKMFTLGALKAEKLQKHRWVNNVGHLVFYLYLHPNLIVFIDAWCERPHLHSPWRNILHLLQVDSAWGLGHLLHHGGGQIQGDDVRNQEEY